MIRNPFKQMDMDRIKRSSNLFSQKQDSDKTINTRLRIVVGVVSAIFVVVIFRLVYLQIINQDSYDEKLRNYTAIKQSFSSPRGAILDCDGNVLVESVSSLTISYYPVKNVSEEEEWELAEKLVSSLALKATTITERQLKELHINYLEVMEDDDSEKVLTKKQLQKIANREYQDLDEIFEWKVARTDVSKLDDHTKSVYQVKMRMDGFPENKYKVIAEDVTKEQISFLSENSANFPGFKATFDWKRNYSETGTNLKAILGNVSSQTQGIPSEEKDYYLALGYDLNDRIGLSGLEKQYEKYLSGSKSIFNIKFDEQGVAFLEASQAGKKGYDLTLSLDQEYQKKMDDLVLGTLESFQASSANHRMSDLYLVAMNPNTGEIISMSGATKSEDGKYFSNPTGTYLQAYRVGSIVKPATLYMGLNEGVIQPGEVILDAPMSIKGTKTFQSYTNKGLINDLEAIRQSSNVYMAHIALRLGGNTYSPGMSMSTKNDTFSLMRTYYNMFGLGVKTGIDLPDEQIGAIGADNIAGTILYYSIGQYDSYTAMQAVQYASTLANGGKRVQPHLLNKVSEVNDAGTTIYNFTTNVLSTLIGDKSLLERSRTGMEMCVSSGSCGLNSGNIGVPMAAKTGTAEDIIKVNGVFEEVSNSALVAYGPTENPEVAFACLAPSANNSNVNVCSLVVESAAKEYFANHRNK